MELMRQRSYIIALRQCFSKGLFEKMLPRIRMIRVCCAGENRSPLDRRQLSRSQPPVCILGYFLKPHTDRVDLKPHYKTGRGPYPLCCGAVDDVESSEATVVCCRGRADVPMAVQFWVVPAG